MARIIYSAIWALVLSTGALFAQRSYRAATGDKIHRAISVSSAVFRSVRRHSSRALSRPVSGSLRYAEFCRAIGRLPVYRQQFVGPPATRVQGRHHLHRERLLAHGRSAPLHDYSDSIVDHQFRNRFAIQQHDRNRASFVCCVGCTTRKATSCEKDSMVEFSLDGAAQPVDLWPSDGILRPAFSLEC